MKKYHLVFIIFIFLSLIGCEKNTEGSAQLDVNFKLEYNEAPLVFLSDVSYPDGRTMIFNRVSFFLSEVTLIKGNISSTSDDVKMVNFNASNGSLASALMGETVQFAGFEENDYSQIRICIGVDKKNNAKDPSKFSNTH
ncbi:MAG TPA: hypothetical protein PKD85_15215, partial [Saprospiraceae bacterium]|nr:hypothetical protein [Saprospiraceae bacterium]